MSTDPKTEAKCSESKDLANMETLHLDRWPQSPRVMIKARVIYLLRYLGVAPADLSPSKDTFQEAVEYVRRAKNLYGKVSYKKLQKVRLEISAHCINIVEDKGGLVLNHADLANVATCGGKKSSDLDREFFVYVARNAGKFEAHVFLSTYSYSTITSTIQEAFEIHYYLKTRPEEDIYQSKAELHTQRNCLEEENRRLRKRVEELEKMMGNRNFYQIFPKADENGPQNYFNSLPRGMIEKPPPPPTQRVPTPPETPNLNNLSIGDSPGTSGINSTSSTPKRVIGELKEKLSKMNERESLLIVPSNGSMSSDYGEVIECKIQKEGVEDKIYEEIGEYYDSTYLIPKRKEGKR
ncbi:unnamed protein product [Bursaphelenchus xylophilus]|uniref:(pine wood nematode) hypothetical protein n=1 Tax=Bursaphelenchus xylophilus TaxID=6326 RepID=A0A1I7SQ29_BURXY|nr:unnamed protein product [Bursaphelenchus xylophilus]CAG9109538.1 unnamed protein product [Bursaphelenchus xylophilus]